MQVAITPLLEEFAVEAVKDGRYASVNAVVNEGLRLLAEKERKLTDLRATIDASIARGGSHTPEEVEQFLQEAREERAAQRKRLA